MQANNSNILSVTDLNQLVKDLLADAIGQIWLMGEISNFSKPSSGHWYFTLKDERAQVRCAMFRNSNFKAGFLPENGQQVIARATVTLYEARGEYQLIIDKLQPAGAGLLQQRFTALKQKLQDEGLFATELKQSLPSTIRTVGIITSATGAALHDICQILQRRDPRLHIIIYPTLVQGNEAAAQISRMIKLANLRQECDVLIVGRGGGSLEDLWPFNEEEVARAIAASQLPIISAVGHEIDFTIADFVADIRAATPSAAAELVSKDKQDQLKRLTVQEQYLAMAMDYYLLQKKEQLNRARHRLQQQHPLVKLAAQQTQLVKLTQRLSEASQTHLNKAQQTFNNLRWSLYQHSPQPAILLYQQHLKQQCQQVQSLLQQHLTQATHQLALRSSQMHSASPLATLARGYSVTTDRNQHLVKSTKQLKLGEPLYTQLSDGQIISIINQIKEKEHG